MVIGTIVLLAIGAGLAWIWPPLAIPAGLVLIWLFAFFRDPHRDIPNDPRAMVSPADGTVSDITHVDSHPLLGEPCVRVGIFLSVFNVHVNRSPCDGVIGQVNYKEGKFVNAMKHNEASEQNESNTILLLARKDGPPVAVVKQIVGLIARRIVCTAGVGDALSRGQRFGMIKFGSRTELYIPMRLGPKVQVEVGRKVRGAADIIALLDHPLEAMPQRKDVAP